MARQKKSLDEAFHSAVTNTLGRASPYELAKGKGLPYQAIARVLEGTNPELSRAIEIANVLGFELRYVWPDDKAADQVVVDDDTRGGGEVKVSRLATWLAVDMVSVMRPEFRELTEHPLFLACAEAVRTAGANMDRELGPVQTGDPGKMFSRLTRVIEMQKAARAKRGA